MIKPTVNYRNKHIVIILGCLYFFISGLIFRGYNNILDTALLITAVIGAIRRKLREIHCNKVSFMI